MAPVETAIVLGVGPVLGQPQEAAPAVAQAEPGRGIHRGRGLRLVGGLIWLAVVIYMLYLATRAVRALEKWSDKRPGGTA